MQLHQKPLIWIIRVWVTCICSNEKGRLYLGTEWAELESFSIKGLQTQQNYISSIITACTLDIIIIIKLL